ncbi:MAG: type II toxin-antitoxin system RelE/ParE family toxin [Deltaproteobacteria bacterium]|nr:type II toxin-antitoxin system RelE/ParE family toxin [Deltaproteobacteria bacterium]
MKSLKRLPKKDLRRIKKKIDRLAEDLPDPATTKMKGNNPFHRVRSGDYRIVYQILEDRLAPFPISFIKPFPQPGKFFL